MMQNDFFQLIDEQASVRLHHALGLAGGPGGEHDDQRMRGGNLLVAEVTLIAALEESLPAQGVGGGGNGSVYISGVMGVNHALHARHILGELSRFGGDVKSFSFVVVGIGREEHLGLDLAEAIRGGLRADIRGAGAPDNTGCGCGEHGNNGFGEVGHIGGHSIAGFQTFGTQGFGDAENLGAQFAPGNDAALGIFTAEDEGGFIAFAFAQHILRVVQHGPGEPLGSGKFVEIVDNFVIGFGGLNLKELPELVPEEFRFFNTPIVKFAVILKLQSVPGFQLLHEGHHLRFFAALRGSAPKFFSHLLFSFLSAPQLDAAADFSSVLFNFVL